MQNFVCVHKVSTLSFQEAVVLKSSFKKENYKKIKICKKRNYFVVKCFNEIKKAEEQPKKNKRKKSKKSNS